MIGACNTVVVEEDGTMTGHITDGTGFVRNLKEHSVEVKEQKIVVLGTGGAATAIAVQAALDGVAEIAIFNRKDEFFANGEKTVEKIKKAVPTIGKVYIEDLDNTEKLRAVIAESDILINATRAGMAPLQDVIPVPEDVLRPELAVADVVYNPLETLLVKKAKEAGCRAAIGGIGMLLWQGAAAFELFTGKEMPVEEVKEKFEISNLFRKDGQIIVRVVTQKRPEGYDEIREAAPTLEDVYLYEFEVKGAMHNNAVRKIAGT